MTWRTRPRDSAGNSNNLATRLYLSRRISMGPSMLTACEPTSSGRLCRIHPLGRSYGTVPEGFDTSVVALQRAAADDEAQKRSTFTPLVWSPTGVTSDDPRQQKLLSDAQSDPHYLISSLETLKSTILRSLEPPPEAPSKPSGKNDVLTIYMICGRSDLDAVRPVESFLIDQGYDVILPLFDGDERELREDHEQSLATCDAVVIYYGASTEFWQRTKLRDLRKAIGYGRYRPFSVRYIFCADPKRAIRSHSEATN